MIGKIVSLVLKPREFFEKSKKETNLDDAIKLFLFALVAGSLLLAVAQNAVVAITSALLTTLMLFTFSATSHFTGKTFFKAKGSYRDTLRIWLYCLAVILLVRFAAELVNMAPSLLLPVQIISAIAILYIFYALVVGLSVVHGTTMLLSFIMLLGALIATWISLGILNAMFAYLWFTKYV